MKTDQKLDKLVEQGSIKSYEYDIVSSTGEVGKQNDQRDTERLIIKFNDGNEIKIECFCSGSLQNAVLFFD